MTKTYNKMKVEYMIEAWGGPCSFFAKGYHDPEEFLEAVKSWCKENPEVGDDYQDYADDYRLARPDLVKQVWCRTSPLSREQQENEGMAFYYLYPREEGERGAFPMTLIELW